MDLSLVAVPTPLRTDTADNVGGKQEKVMVHICIAPYATANRPEKQRHSLNWLG